MTQYEPPFESFPNRFRPLQADHTRSDQENLESHRRDEPFQIPPNNSAAVPNTISGNDAPSAAHPTEQRPYPYNSEEQVRSAAIADAAAEKIVKFLVTRSPREDIELAIGKVRGLFRRKNS